MSKKKPSEGMKAMYAQKRKKTADRIQSAIDEIQDEGRVVTKKELMELTGLSSGTFSQEYVKEILKENRVCQYRDIKALSTEKSREEKTNDLLLKENKSLKSKVADLNLKISVLQDKNADLKEKYNDSQEQLKRLRGKYQQALNYLEVVGGDLSRFPLI